MESAVECGEPELGEQVKLPHCFNRFQIKPMRSLSISADFALAIYMPTTRTVEQSFSTSRNQTYTSCFNKDTMEAQLKCQFYYFKIRQNLISNIFVFPTKAMTLCFEVWNYLVTYEVNCFSDIWTYR